MDVLFSVDDAFYAHDTGPRHPERPARLDAVTRGVEASPAHIIELPAKAATHAELGGVHEATYIQEIERFCAEGGGFLDPDTVAVERSWQAALLAAGAGLAAVEALDRGQASAALLAVRPPGHHALAARAMGFCLFNNVAVTARRLLDRGERVAIVDWDVHHGNGTQDTFWNEPNLLYVSLHQHPFYPFTGAFDEMGAFANMVNVPVPASTAGDFYRAAFAAVLNPRLAAFQPDWVLVSCGFDAHAADPLADVLLLESDYAFMASSVLLEGRTIAFLEGGYDLDAIEQSTSAVLSGFAGIEVPLEDDRPQTPRYAYEVLDLLGT